MAFSWSVIARDVCLQDRVFALDAPPLERGIVVFGLCVVCLGLGVLVGDVLLCGCALVLRCSGHCGDVLGSTVIFAMTSAKS